MRIFRLSLCLFSITLVFQNQLRAAGNCPGWFRGDTTGLPLCPKGQRLLPETFPAAAVVFSDDMGSGLDSKKAVELASKIIKAHEDNPRFPALVASVRDESLKRIQEWVESHYQSSPEKKAKILSALVQVKDVAYPWQQDYFKAFINPTNGIPQLREVEGYQIYHSEFELKASWFSQVPRGYGVDSLQKVLRDCGFIEGERLLQPVDKNPSIRADQSKNKAHTSGTDGGNIIALPGGLCGIGTDKFANENAAKSYAAQFCNPSDIVLIDTSWLEVGHVDEILKVIKNPGATAPCDVSIVIASPQKAIELLEKNPQGNFISKDQQTDQDKKKIAELFFDSEDYGDLCAEAMRGEVPERTKNYNSERGVARNYFLERVTAESAFAFDFNHLIPSFYKQWARNNCVSMKNGQVAAVLKKKNSNLAKYNENLQVKLNYLKKEIQGKLNRKMAKQKSCEIDFLEVPQIFIGGIAFDDGKVTRSMGNSLLPNPPNSLLAHETIISNDPMNGEFRNYLKAEYAKKGYKPDFFDNAREGSLNKGNVHCLTQVIPVCRPP